MQEYFEKIKERLEKTRYSDIYGGWETMRIDKAIEIVNQVAEEYKTKECMHNQYLTNADRIRAMSDEELADWYVIKCNIMMNKNPPECRNTRQVCRECILEWLQSEVEE